MDDRAIRISGGAGPFEAAAIAVVIQHILETEAAARSKPPRRNTPPAWIRLGAPQPFGRYNPPVRPEWGPNAP
jgi:hypothetical protein